MSQNKNLKMIEAKIDIEKLISEIENRQPLWDMTISDYSDKMKRKQCWEELAGIFSAGSELTTQEKTKLEEILMKKWKNIRDRFIRDVHEQKGRSGSGARKKSPYIFSKQLQFLKVVVQPRETDNSLQPTFSNLGDMHNADVGQSEDEEDTDNPREIAQPSTSDGRISLQSQPARIGKRKMHPVEAKIIECLENLEKRGRADQPHEASKQSSDEHFLLSLEKDLAALPRHLNRRCRVEIMQCINKYEAMSQLEAQPQSVCNMPTNQPYAGYQPQNSWPPYQQQHHHPNPSQSSYPFPPVHPVERQYQSPMPTSSPAAQSPQYDFPHQQSDL